MEETEPDNREGTPSPEYRKRRDPEVEKEWRLRKGRTPSYDLNNQRDKINWDATYLLIHILAKDLDINLSLSPLRPQFFKEFIRRYGNTHGGARYGHYLSADYIQKVWRERFCVKKTTKGGHQVADVHLYGSPQEEETPCHICNPPNDDMYCFDSTTDVPASKKVQLEMGDRTEILVSEEVLPKTPGTYICQACQMNFKSLQTFKHHMKVKHQEKVDANNEKELKCPCCLRKVKDLQRHMTRDCRAQPQNKQECPHCKSIFTKSRLNEHIKSRFNKFTGEITRQGCADKHLSLERDQSNDLQKEKEKIVCSLCQKTIQVENFKKHIKNVHMRVNTEGAESTSETYQLSNAKATNRSGSYPAVRSNIFTTRLQLLRRALGDIQFQQNMANATDESRRLNPNNLTPSELVQAGREFGRERGMNFSQAGSYIRMDGDCLWSSVALSLHPNLDEQELHEEAINLRRRAVGWAIGAITDLSEDQFQLMQGIAGELRIDNQDSDDLESPSNPREMLRRQLSEYLYSGKYQGDLGDILPQVASSYIQTPIMIIMQNVQTGNANAYVLSPRTIFNISPQNTVPLVFVNQADHYEVLHVAPESEQDMQDLFLAEYPPQDQITADEAQVCMPLSEHNQGNQYPIPSPERVQEKIQSGTSSTNQATQDFINLNLAPRQGPELNQQETEHQFKAPNPNVGDRKKVLRQIVLMPTSCQARLNMLLASLDKTYVNIPCSVKEMEAAEGDIETFLRVVDNYVKRSKGEIYSTAATDMMGSTRDTSSIEIYRKIIGNKILPFLRYYCYPNRNDFNIMDLLAFGQPTFERIEEDMVVECNTMVGNSASLKRVILNCWQKLFQAILHEAKKHYKQLGDDGLRSLREWYEDLKTQVGWGVNHMTKQANRARLEKKKKVVSEDYIPVDQAISKWLASDTRTTERNLLLDLSRRIRAGENDVPVTAQTYLKLSEFVQTELSIYGPVRIGAIGKLTHRTFVRSQAAWSVTDEESSRPVTLPPKEACIHQRKVSGNMAAKLGFKENGERCCEESFPNTCFIMPNEKDKGAKTDSWLVLTNADHELLSAFLTVRKDYFRQKMPLLLSRIEGNSSIFLNSKGQEPRSTSDFKLTTFNRVVYGENSQVAMTPQDLRKWNSTFLSQHPDSRVRDLRGTVTGNSDVVFERHYNLSRQAGVLDTLLTSLRRHRTEENPAVWTSQDDERRKRDAQIIEDANQAVLFQADGIDRTSHKHPVHCHLRHQFRRELDNLYPGLWQRGGTQGNNRGQGLSEIIWVHEVISILGLENAERLREIIVEQYGGDQNPAKRRWSGSRTHLETIKNEKTQTKDTTRNCGLFATLKLFYSSAQAKNKSRRGKEAKELSEETSSSEDI